MRINIEGGYILVSKKIVESEIWDKPPLYLKIWLYLLVKAQYKPYKNLDRGQTVVTIPELIEVGSYKVGYRTEKPSKTQIFNILEWLRNSHEGSHEDDMSKTMIETTKTTRGLVVNICNYNVYQNAKNYERNDEDYNEQFTNETMLERQADTINKNLKKDKEIKEDKKNVYDPHFESFWQIYPKRVAKKDAAKAFHSLIKSGKSLEDILTATRNYAREREGQDPKFTQHPTTFLRTDRWEDWLSVKEVQQRPEEFDPRDKDVAQSKWAMRHDPERFRWHKEENRAMTLEEVEAEEAREAAELEQRKKEFEQLLERKQTTSTSH